MADNKDKKSMNIDDRGMVLEPKYGPDSADENGYYKGAKKKDEDEKKDKKKDE